MDGVWKSYDNRAVLTDFSMSISDNEFVAIMGASGAGKTTILNLIASLDKPDKGSVKVDDQAVTKNIHYRRYKLGYVFQNYFLLNNETVLKNLLISKPYSKEFNGESIHSVLELVGLDDSYLKKKVHQLSGGEKQRVAIARTVLKPSEIILADEPTGNLDPENAQKIIDLFHELKVMGKTIVCVTHDKRLADSADRVIML